MTAAQKAVRITKLEASHVTVYNALTATPQSIAQIATTLGITQDAAEKKLAILVDESLATRMKGDRVSARYTLA